jgi:integrase
MSQFLKVEDGPAKNHDSFIHRFQEDIKKLGVEGKFGFMISATRPRLSCLRGGTDLKTVKEVCGHKDISTTMNYVHMLGGECGEAIKKSSTSTRFQKTKTERR